MYQTSGGVSGKGEGKTKANPERCDCNTLAKNQILGKVIAFPGEEQKCLDLTHTAPTATFPPALSSPVPKFLLWTGHTAGGQ